VIHAEQSRLAGKTVRVKPHVEPFGGSGFVVEDWWDRIAGKSWGVCNGNPACINYAIRTGLADHDVPDDDEVLYGKIGPLGHLLHISELESVTTSLQEGLERLREYGTNEV